MITKKRKLNLKKLIIVLIVCFFVLFVLSFLTIKIIKFISNSGIKGKEVYSASIYNNIDLYDEEYNIVGDIVRGTKIFEYSNKKIKKDDNLELVKIKHNDKIYYVKTDNIVTTKKSVVLEIEKFVRTNVTVYKSKDDIDIISYIPKGEKIEILGYDYLKEDGSVNMYEIKHGDTKGYVYSKYLVDTEELAKLNYDQEGTYIIHSTKLTDPYKVGNAGDLDFYPREKPKFKDNIMPDTVKSLYLNSTAIKRVDEYIKVAQEIGANAFVVDIKDGVLAYKSDVAKEYAKTAYEKAVDTLENYKNNVKKLKDAGFYVIGRIVIFNDTHYALDNMEDVIVYKSNGALFGGQHWLTPYSRRVWEYNVKLATEAVNNVDFDEIQYDYVRFPDRTTNVNDQLDFKNKYGESKAQAVQNFLMYAVDELHKLNVYVSADVFGESAGNYVTGYGQYWPAISNVVDVISGMPYPDHFSSHAYGIKEIVWTVPEELLTKWGEDVVKRQGTIKNPAIVRTWVQAYNTIHAPYIEYGDKELQAQIKGLYKNGLNGGWMTWSSSSNIDKYRSFNQAFKVNYE